MKLVLDNSSNGIFIVEDCMMEDATYRPIHNFRILIQDWVKLAMS